MGIFVGALVYLLTSGQLVETTKTSLITQNFNGYCLL